MFDRFRLPVRAFIRFTSFVVATTLCLSLTANPAVAEDFTLDVEMLEQQAPVVMKGKRLKSCGGTPAKDCYRSESWGEKTFDLNTPPLPRTWRWDSFISKNPKVPTFRLARVVAAAQAHDFKAALVDVNILLRQWPGIPSAWMLRAELYAVAGRDDLALRDLEAADYWVKGAWQMQGGSADFRLSDLPALRARIYIRQGKYDLATAALDGYQKSRWASDTTYPLAIMTARQHLAAAQTGVSAGQFVALDDLLDKQKIDSCKSLPVLDQVGNAGYRTLAVARARMELAAACGQYDKALAQNDILLAGALKNFGGPELKRADVNRWETQMNEINHLFGDRAGFFEKAGKFNKAAEEWNRAMAFSKDEQIGWYNRQLSSAVYAYQKALDANQPIDPEARKTLTAAVQVRIAEREKEKARIASIGRVKFCSADPARFEVLAVYVPAGSNSGSKKAVWLERYERGGCTRVVEVNPAHRVEYATSFSSFRGASKIVRCAYPPKSGHYDIDYGCPSGEYQFYVLDLIAEAGKLTEQTLSLR